MNITFNKNKVLTALQNMVIGQHVYADNQKGSATLADRYRTDGTLYGDTKLFYSTDILASYAFAPKGNDGTGGMSYNLLTEFLPRDPQVQKVVIDKFRQIPLTMDNKLSKQAFMTEGAFGDFVSVMYQQVRDTKLVYEAGLINTFIGTKVSSAPAANVTVTLASESGTAVESEAAIRGNALRIADAMANLKTELEDFSRGFNEYGHMRSYDWSDFDVIWNATYLNKIQTSALPTVFHNGGLITEGVKPLPSKYFGSILTTVTQADTEVAVLIEELDYTVAGAAKHGMPGEKLAQGTYTAPELLAIAGKVLKPDSKVIAKVIHKDAIKYMAAFEAATEFFNAQTLRTNSYLTWGYGTPEHLKNYPLITIKAS